LLLLLIITSVISIGPITSQVSVLATDQWSLPEEICNGYYPSITQLDGTIWLAYTTAQGANDVMVRSSSDGGLTWSSPKNISSAKTPWVAWVAQGTTFLSSNGELWLAWHANRNPAGGTAEIWYTKSIDGGATWSEPRKPYEGDAPWNGYAWPRLVDMQNKIWLFFSHTESSLYMTTSDRGSSWSEPFELAPYYSQKQAPSAEYINGKIWLVYTKWDAGPADDGMTPGQEIHLITSTDGITWSSPKKICNATAPYGAQSTAFIKFYNGKVLVFFNSWADEKWSIYLTTSNDGISWSNPERIIYNTEYHPQAIGSPTIIDGKIWLAYTSPDGEIWYTTLEPPPMHILVVTSTPITGVPILVDGQSHSTPTSPIELQEGQHTVAITSTVQVGSDTYNFNSWEDGSTNPTRNINLTAGLTITASYQLVPTPPLAMWQQWWFWTIIVLSIIAVLLVFTALRYRKKALASKEIKVTPSMPTPKEYIACPNCGANLPADSKFCGKCGASLE